MPLTRKTFETLIANAAACAAVALLAACQAPLPTEVVEPGTQTVHLLVQEPHRAAICIARNTDKSGRRVTSTIREGAAPALVEVAVSDEQPVGLVSLYVEGDGSRAEIAMRPLTVERRNAWLAVMLQGC